MFALLVCVRMYIYLHIYTSSARRWTELSWVGALKRRRRMSSMMLFCDGQSWFSYEVDVLRQWNGLSELWRKRTELQDTIIQCNSAGIANAPSTLCVNGAHQNIWQRTHLFHLFSLSLFWRAYGFAISFGSVSRGTHRWRRQFIFANLSSVHRLAVKCDTFSTVSIHKPNTIICQQF